MQVKVEATSKEATKTAKGEYTGIKYDGKWVNVWGNHVGTKGQMINITTPEQFKQKDGTLSKTFWAKEIEDEPGESGREPEHRSIEPSDKRGFSDVGNKAVWLASEFAKYVPAGDWASVSNIMLKIITGYIDGKIINDSVEEIQEEEAPF